MKKVLIHASLDLIDKMVEARDYFLSNSGNIEVILPDLNRYQHIRDELGDDKTFTQIKHRLTMENFRNVERCDMLLILNHTHRNIENYVGGNSFMEMVVAAFLSKPIYLINDIPENMPYTEEIKSLYPIILSDLSDLLKICEG